jgi:DNA-binding transcriptional LysR family regulator
LAARARISVRELRGKDLISLPRGTGLRACLDEACARAGFSPHVAFEASDPENLADLAGRNLGVAIVPESVTKTRPHLRAIELARPTLRGRLAFAWRREGPGSPAARVLIERARAAWAAF